MGKIDLDPSFNPLHKDIEKYLHELNHWENAELYIQAIEMSLNGGQTNEVVLPKRPKGRFAFLNLSEGPSILLATLTLSATFFAAVFNSRDASANFSVQPAISTPILATRQPVPSNIHLTEIANQG